MATPLTTMRLDPATLAILARLASDLHTNRTEAVRRLAALAQHLCTCDSCSLTTCPEWAKKWEGK